MNTDQPDGRDLESRAQLHRVVLQAAGLHRTLRALADEYPLAAHRAGIDAETLDVINNLASRALWASTADLHQRREHEFAKRVAERATEIERADQQHPQPASRSR